MTGSSLPYDRGRSTPPAIPVASRPSRYVIPQLANPSPSLEEQPSWRQREQDFARERNIFHERTSQRVTAAILSKVELDLSELSLAASRNHRLNNQSGEPVPTVTLRSQSTTATILPQRQSSTPRRPTARNDRAPGQPSSANTRPHRNSGDSDTTTLRSGVSRDRHSSTSNIPPNQTQYVPIGLASRSSSHSVNTFGIPSPSVALSSTAPPSVALSSTAPPSVASSSTARSTAAAPPDDSDDEPQGIRQIDPNDGEEHRRWYVITRGKGKIGVFGTWIRAAPHCNGIKGAHYKGYATRKRALKAFYGAEREGLTAFL